MNYEWKAPEEGAEYTLSVGNCPEAWIACSDEETSINVLLSTDPIEVKRLINAILAAAGMQDMDQDWMPEPR